MTDRADTTVAGMQFVLIALIASHPDKKALLAQFDKLSSEHKVAATVLGGGLAPPVWNDVEVWRKIIVELLDTGQDSPQKVDLDLRQCKKIVSAYGAALEKGPAPGTVADESELPYPKQTIKQALVTLLRATSDSQLRGNLKAGYLSLSDWQRGVGPHRVGFDFGKFDRTSDALSIAKRHAAAEESARPLLTKAEVEQQALASELRKMGF